MENGGDAGLLSNTGRVGFFLQDVWRTYTGKPQLAILKKLREP